MNSSETIETEAPPATVLVEEELTQESFADGEPPVLTEEASPEPAFARSSDRLVSALIYAGVLLVGVAGGAALVYGLSGSSSGAPAAATPGHDTVVATPGGAAAIASRKQIEDVAMAAEGSNEPVANQLAASGETPEQSPPVAAPNPQVVAAQAPIGALEAAVAAERTRAAPMQTAHLRAQPAQGQSGSKPLKTAECSFTGDDIAAFKKCVEKFNQ